MSETAIVKTSQAAKVNQVAKWAINCASEFDIQEAIEKTWPDVKARPLIVAAIKRFEETAEGSPKIALGWCIEAARCEHQKAVESGDIAGALRAIKLIRELTKG